VSSVLFDANCLGKQVSWQAVCSLAPIVWARKLVCANMGSSVTCVPPPMRATCCWTVIDMAVGLARCSSPRRLLRPVASGAQEGYFSMGASCVQFLHHVCDSCITCAIPAPCVQFLHHVCKFLPRAVIDRGGSASPGISQEPRKASMWAHGLTANPKIGAGCAHTTPLGWPWQPRQFTWCYVAVLKTPRAPPHIQNCCFPPIASYAFPPCATSGSSRQCTHPQTHACK